MFGDDFDVINQQSTDITGDDLDCLQDTDVPHSDIGFVVDGYYVRTVLHKLTSHYDVHVAFQLTNKRSGQRYLRAPHIHVILKPER